MTDLDQRRADFGERLRQLRERAGHASGAAFARHLGWQQSKVSRIETGAQLATDSDIGAWIEATGLSGAKAAGLAAEARELRLAAASWKRQARTGLQARQEHAVTIESAASLIRAFETALVPGLLQTADYARHVLTVNAEIAGRSTDVEEAVAVRMRRQAVLYDRAKTIEIVMTESALRYPLCPADVMAGQLDRLATLLDVSTARIGVIPLGTRLPVVPLHGFWIIDDQAIVETSDTELVVHDADDLALYHRMLDALWTVAVEGENARDLVRRIPSSS
ncbi:helix-turn-helix domain-containing protein [Actinokineospora fastidiosa]|uniref:Transcriptional regulator n=1 Tax=Actinokineospora fastidiosa TaxID=1816 RepID=A0A918LES8_9PSEU|nr:helix-turn-helix transcriptional regulator [Actinokineospora fastidiosa]GGS37048.1 transcriptional regulator [Actinokineospora fastidiosa]